jgi:hypothetical protein
LEDSRDRFYKSPFRPQGFRIHTYIFILKLWISYRPEATRIILSEYYDKNVGFR